MKVLLKILLTALCSAIVLFQFWLFGQPAGPLLIVLVQVVVGLASVFILVKSFGVAEGRFDLGHIVACVAFVGAGVLGLWPVTAGYIDKEW